MTSLAVSGDGQCLLVGMLDGRMCLLDASDGSVMAEYRGHVSTTAKVDAEALGDGHVIADPKMVRSSSGSWWTRADVEPRHRWWRAGWLPRSGTRW